MRPDRPGTWSRLNRYFCRVQKTIQEERYGTRSIALAPRHPIADHSFDLVARRFARLIFIDLRLFRNDEEQSAKARRKPGFPLLPLTFRPPRRYITLAA
jgi:hypothetical protein